MDTLASPADSFRHLTDVASHYEKKLSEVSSGAASALTVLRAIAKDIDRDGLYKAKEFNEDEAPYVSSLSHLTKLMMYVPAGDILTNRAKQTLYASHMLMDWRLCPGRTLEFSFHVGTCEFNWLYRVRH